MLKNLLRIVYLMSLAIAFLQRLSLAQDSNNLMGTDLLNQNIYLASTESGHMIVTYSSNDAYLKAGDYITHADDIKFLTTGFDKFVNNNTPLTIVPVVDDDDSKEGGNRLLGFVKLERLNIGTLSVRRSEIRYDMNEGGSIFRLVSQLEPQGILDFVQKSMPSDFQLPSDGGGSCISSEDCYFKNGTCTSDGLCACRINYTGGYCQLSIKYKPFLTDELKKWRDSEPQRLEAQRKETQRRKEEKEREEQKKLEEERKRQAEIAAAEAAAAAKAEAEMVRIREEKRAALLAAAAAEAREADSRRVFSSTGGTTTTTSSSGQFMSAQEEEAAAEAALEQRTAAAGADSSAGVGLRDLPRKMKAKVKAGARKRKPGPGGGEGAGNAQSGESNQGEGVGEGAGEKDRRMKEEDERRKIERMRLQEEREEQQKAQREKFAQRGVNLDGDFKESDLSAAGTNTEAAGASQKGSTEQVAGGPPNRKEEEVAIKDLYGPGRPYPEPYPAGKVSSNIASSRFVSRREGQSFIYSVRFRNGPLGLSFDNKPANATVVEKVTPASQAFLSEIQAGDKLIAVDMFNVSSISARVTQRILASRSWPLLLVFESRGKADNSKAMEENTLMRSYNLTILFPPTLVGKFEVRFAEWTPPPAKLLTNSGISTVDSCPIFVLRSSHDPFGCKQANNEEFDLAPIVYSKMGIDANTSGAWRGLTDKASTEMLTMMLEEAKARGVPIAPRPAAVVKRGICTFVDKAKVLVSGKATMGLMINNEDALMDIPAGKEKTHECIVPLSVARESDGLLLQLVAARSEVIAYLSDDLSSDTTGTDTSASSSVPAAVTKNCRGARALANDIIDQWAHSVPPVTPEEIMRVATITSRNKEVFKSRGKVDEGGRIAVSGQNGWAFFDYHLAYFGPQEVPLGPLRLQVADPPFGCDLNTYNVRVKDCVVVILRGGGCSFGIKVINAQKLGAKAVIIMNNDDVKTMRLNALPDEIPLIRIPTITVSRRLQFYLEEQLEKFYEISQHIVSIQPTGLFGRYEERNKLVLPMRLPGK